MISTPERAYEGGQTLELAVDLGSIPLFIRSGAILPMAVNRIDNLMKQQTTGIRYLCAPDKDGAFDSYTKTTARPWTTKEAIYLKTKISIQAGEKTVLSFTTEGDYDTGVEDMQIDMIHREKSPSG